jgi:hypothetical protein
MVIEDHIDLQIAYIAHWRQSKMTGHVNLLPRCGHKPPLAVSPYSSLAVILIILVAPSCLESQTEVRQPSDTRVVSRIGPTLTLGQQAREANLESDDPETKYQNGFFVNGELNGHVRVWDKDGRPVGNFTIRLRGWQGLVDTTVLKDGSVVASFVNMVPNDDRRYYSLVHYNSTGSFLEKLDLGLWRATAICAADDQTIWALSVKQEYGVDLYSPEEGVLRNYKFGSGLQRAVVPRSTFPNDDGHPYAQGRVGISCSSTGIHVLTADNRWIEYVPGRDFSIKEIEQLDTSMVGGRWRLAGFAYLDAGRAYVMIHSEPGDPFRRFLAELLPTTDGAKLRWVEVPSGGSPLVNAQRSDVSASQSAKSNQQIVVKDLFGADHDSGDSLVYRLSSGNSALWSEPSFANRGN